MSNSKILQIFSPLIFFIIHVIYLVFSSQEPLFNKWIDGSFSFFVSLILCNILRARILAQTALIDSHDDSGRDHEGPENNTIPK